MGDQEQPLGRRIDGKETSDSAPTGQQAAFDFGFSHEQMQLLLQQPPHSPVLENSAVVAIGGTSQSSIDWDFPAVPLQVSSVPHPQQQQQHPIPRASQAEQHVPQAGQSFFPPLLDQSALMATVPTVDSAVHQSPSPGIPLNLLATSVQPMGQNRSSTNEGKIEASAQKRKLAEASGLGHSISLVPLQQPSTFVDWSSTIPVTGLEKPYKKQKIEATTTTSSKEAALAPKNADPTSCIPTTSLPPSVLVSVLPPPVNSALSLATKQKQQQQQSRPEHQGLPPQDYLNEWLVARGFAASVDKLLRIRADDSAYDVFPSALQLASFGTEMVKAVHNTDLAKLRGLLACGLSPNPCNQFRDSLVDLVCKRANERVFKVLMDFHCDIRVCDGFGRAPLHHCCWANHFSSEIATSILNVDPQQLFMEDKRGQTPLEYVRAEQAGAWISFLESNLSTFFPAKDSLPQATSLKQARKHGMLPDPSNALPVRLATAVSSGALSPLELQMMTPEDRMRY